MTPVLLDYYLYFSEHTKLSFFDLEIHLGQSAVNNPLAANMFARGLLNDLHWESESLPTN